MLARRLVLSGRAPPAEAPTQRRSYEETTRLRVAECGAAKASVLPCLEEQELISEMALSWRLSLPGWDEEAVIAKPTTHDPESAIARTVRHSQTPTVERLQTGGPVGAIAAALGVASKTVCQRRDWEAAGPAWRATAASAGTACPSLPTTPRAWPASGCSPANVATAPFALPAPCGR